MQAFEKIELAPGESRTVTWAMAPGAHFLHGGVVHGYTITHEGGLAGIRDPGLLESAVLTPQQQFGGQYLHQGEAAMAAAYLFHIAQNHAFHDGNNRTAALSTLVFLDAKGFDSLPPPEDLEEIALRVAAGQCGKEELTEWMRRQVN